MSDFPLQINFDADVLTSADNMEFLNLGSLVDSFRIRLSALSVLAHNAVYVNLNPKCEPQPGKRGLY